jgi:glycine cleavage system H lipoate-binding protein/ABC-type phosphate transport system substrate-binding protein
MKTKIILFIILAIPCFNILNTMASGDSTRSPNLVTVAATPELYDLTAKWVDEYQKLYPGQMIRLIRYSGENKTAVLKSGTDLTFLTDEYYTTPSMDNLWKMAVGRDAVVLVFNTKNPLRGAVNLKGIDPQRLAMLMSDPGKQQWGTLLGNGQTTPVHCYLLNEESLRQKVAKFLSTDASALNATLVSGGTEMVSAIAKDPNALGICRLTDVLDLNKQELVVGIGLLPIDKNRNGKLDNFENIYGSLQDFLHGVWLGKYPSTLTRNIYTITSVKPEDENHVAFLKWVLADGQQYLNPYGYFDLGSTEREAKLVLLDNKIMLASAPETSHPIQAVMIILLVVILAGSIITWMINYRRNRKQVTRKGFSSGISAFTETAVNVPRGIWFDKSHTWAFMEQNGMVRIGIDDFLQHITGPLTRVKMRNPGEQVQKGEMILTIIQSGKQLNISSPVSGTIRTQNGLLSSRSSALNTAPFTDGWVYTIEPSNWLRETQFLFMAEKYNDWLKLEFIRLKDFFATSVIAAGYTPIVLQDGGELKDNVLAGFGPEVWEDFQVKFIDASK